MVRVRRRASGRRGRPGRCTAGSPPERQGERPAGFDVGRATADRRSGFQRGQQQLASTASCWRASTASGRRALTAGEWARIVGAASDVANSSWLRWRSVRASIQRGAATLAAGAARRCKPSCGARAAVNVRGSDGVPLRLGQPGRRVCGTGRRRAGGSGDRQDRNRTQAETSGAVSPTCFFTKNSASIKSFHDQAKKKRKHEPSFSVKQKGTKRKHESIAPSTGGIEIDFL